MDYTDLLEAPALQTLNHVKDQNKRILGKLVITSWLPRISFSNH